MMPAPALRKLASWVSVTEMFCEVRSDSVRAITVTLRSIASADENSTVPKNSTSISGTIIANSTAARPLLSPDSSRTERRMRCHVPVNGFDDFVDLFARGFIASPSVRFVLERGRRAQKPLAAAQIRDVVVEFGDDDRPLVKQPHHDDVAGAAGFVIVGIGEVLAGVDRVGDVDGAERRITLHVDGEATDAIE